MRAFSLPVSLTMADGDNRVLEDSNSLQDPDSHQDLSNDREDAGNVIARLQRNPRRRALYLVSNVLVVD